jgi:L-ascorbate metabolism protein UlaG (beta-lactamase superfamily)
MTNNKSITLPGSGDPQSIENGSIFFIGTATTIIRNQGFTILTDPNFLHAGEHAHLGYGLTSERLTNPAIEIDQLPPLDFCILSHMHGDHWDQVAEARLRKDLPITTPKQAADILNTQGFHQTYPLEPWESFTANRGDGWVRVTAMPGKHGPGAVDLVLPDVMGSMVEWGLGGAQIGPRLYISGDTLVFDDLREIPQRYPDIDLALLHLGGTRVMGILVTMDDKQGIEAIHMIEPKEIIPIHYNDYEVFKSPLEDFHRAVSEAGLDSRVHYLKHGETFQFNQLGKTGK